MRNTNTNTHWKQNSNIHGIETENSPTQNLWMFQFAIQWECGLHWIGQNSKFFTQAACKLLWWRRQLVHVDRTRKSNDSDLAGAKFQLIMCRAIWPMIEAPFISLISVDDLHLSIINFQTKVKEMKNG